MPARLANGSWSWRGARRSSGGRGGLLELALDLERARAELLVRGLEQPVVETTVVLDRAQPVGRDAELEALVELLAEQRHVLQVGQKDALGLVVGVAHVVADLAALAGQFADARHGSSLENRCLGVSRKAGRIATGPACVNQSWGIAPPNDSLAAARSDAARARTGARSRARRRGAGRCRRGQ